MGRSQTLIEEFQAARLAFVSSMSIGVTVGSRYWEAPTQGIFHLDVNAAVNDDEGEFGVGAEVRDCEGRMHAALAKTIQRPISVLDAEINAVLYGVGLCLQEGLVPFVVYSDSLLAIRMLANGDESKRYIETDLPILDEVVKAGFVIDFQHMYRDANVVAHALARFGARSGDFCIWNKDFPLWLREVAN